MKNRKKSKEKNKLINNLELIEVKDLIEFNKPIETQDKTFEKLMFIYSIAIRELKIKVEILQEEFKIFYNYELIDHIDTRVKTPESIINKMENKNCNLTYKEMIENINDIAGVRIVCSMKKDIFAIKKLISSIPGINVLKEKDYVTYPKESGYTSYHLIVEIPVRLSNNTIYVKVEIQIRTIAMDFWANLEHKMKYKTDKDINKKVSKEWINCAKIINNLDNKMMRLNFETRDKVSFALSRISY